MQRFSSRAIVAFSTVASFLLLLGASAGAPAPAAAQDAAKPRAVVVSPVKDFGQVSQGQQISHDFEIRNEGTAPLELTRVHPDCGCTVAQFDRIIPPGGTGKVHADIDTAVLAGPVSRRITVYTNDPAHPRLELTFKVDATPKLNVHPGYARYQVVIGEEEPGILRQTVYAIDGSDFEITGVDSPWPHLTTRHWPAKAEERIEHERAKGAQWVVEMNFDYNRAPVGPLAQELVIHTNHPTQKKILLPISGFVRPGLWSTPRELDIGEVRVDTPQKVSIVVQSFLADPVAITGVKSSWGEALQAEVVPIQDGRKFSVQITMTSEMPKGALDGKLEIATDTPKMPVLEVPVRGTIL